MLAYKCCLWRMVRRHLRHLPSELGPASVRIELLLRVLVGMDRVASKRACRTSWSQIGLFILLRSHGLSFVEFACNPRLVVDVPRTLQQRERYAAAVAAQVKPTEFYSGSTVI